MQVFKFGGALIKNPEAFHQFKTIVAEQKTQPLVIVVSAMGQTTRYLEDAFYQKLNTQSYEATIEQIYRFHQNIIEHVLNTSCLEAWQELVQVKKQLLRTLTSHPTSGSPDRLYSNLVGWGEILASKIIYHYLQEQALPCIWVDARKYIKTNHSFRDALVDWESTKSLVQQNFMLLLERKNWILTQGFIGSDQDGVTTTLGKEGSDTTGAMLAAALGAESLTTWKDVPGIMNADPKLFQGAIKFERLSYQEMAMMAFYGAQVIHTKAIQPLAMQDIPLYVKPFYNKESSGTRVFNGQPQASCPIYVLLKDQCLVRLTLKVFMFFDEYQIHIVLKQLTKLRIKVNMLAKTADSLSICLNNAPLKLRLLLETLHPSFQVYCDSPVNLLTVMHHLDKSPPPQLLNKTILLEQQDQALYQAVFKADEQHDKQRLSSKTTLMKLT